MSLIPYRRNGAAITSFDPFRMMAGMEREFFGSQRSGSFSTDIRETESAYILEADLPGFNKEDIHVDISQDTLTITAERHSSYEDQEKKGSYIRCERSYGSYARSFSLDGVDTEAIKAAYANGVLTLTMPKRVEPKVVGRRLEIEG